MSRQDCREEFRRLGSLPTRKMVVSSAKSAVESGVRSFGRSMMKTDKRVGPSIEPWGTPDEREP
jgi:hypothetical protein